MSQPRHLNKVEYDERLCSTFPLTALEIWGQLPKLKAIHVKTTSGKISHARLPPNGARGLHGCTLTDPFRGVPRHSFFSMPQHCLHSNHAAGRLIYDVGVVRNWGPASLNCIGFPGFPVKSFSRGFRWSKFRRITQSSRRKRARSGNRESEKDILLPGVHRA